MIIAVMRKGETMDDLISRQAAIDALADMHCKSDEDGYVWIIRSDAWARIDALPSAQPEKRTEERTETHACDLIDRQAAIDALDEQIKFCENALCDFNISLKDEYAVKVERASLCAYKEILEYLPSAQPEQRWIPCSESLPEEPYGCLVTVWDTNPITMDEFENILPYFVGWDGEQWNDGDGEQCPFEVTAWMPLPEPYKEDNNA